MLFAIKTDAVSHASQDLQNKSSGFKNSTIGHEYTADEMLPQDKRKLDKIKWKMTNKVAKDYVAYLLGWSRKKEAVVEGGKYKPV